MMNLIEHQRTKIENRIINLCASRHLKNGIMREIDSLCAMMVEAALKDAQNDDRSSAKSVVSKPGRPKYQEPRYDDVFFDGLDAFDRM